MALKEFYGETCPHCIQMKPIVEEVESELGVTIEKLEVWNNEANAAQLTEHDKGLCGGVPFFINTDTGAHICGSSTKPELMKWAKGE